MPAAAEPRLKSGKVYRTADFRRWGKNPTRLARRLEREGELERLGHGLYYAPERSHFGTVPPAEDELLRAFLKTRDYMVAGSRAWNSLGLGSTGVESYPVVYNKKRSGVMDVGGKTFEFRRVRYPSSPSREFFAVDLFENRERAGVDRTGLMARLEAALESGRLSSERLREMAVLYGSKDTQVAIDDAVNAVE